MIRTIVILLMFGLFSHAQANCEENRYVNLPDFRIRVLGQENEALKSLPLGLQIGTKESAELHAVPVAIEFDEATYEYVIPKQIVQVPNTVLPDQIICSQTPEAIVIVVENYKPLVKLQILTDKQEHFGIAQPRLTLEYRLEEENRIVKPALAKAN